MTYYKKLDKEKRKKIKKEYLSSKESIVYKKALKIVILSTLGLVIACGASIFDYIYKTGTLNYILDTVLFIFSIVFLIKMIKIRSKEINKYALAQKKTK